DHFAFIDKERYAHDGTRFELRRLCTARGGVPSQTRIGLDDLELDVRWRSDVERHAVPEHHGALHSVLEPNRTLTERFLAGGVLLKGIRDHEMPKLAIRVQVLHFG